VHSAVCGTDLTLDALDRAGLVPEVLAKATVPFGPVMRARAALLESRGLVGPGQREEDLVVVGAHRA
jgi:release factor glutamine methyltransferase